ncbi:MAG: hypothetical protein AAGC46_08515 [Solirubrobacteraceae bacterium]
MLARTRRRLATSGITPRQDPVLAPGSDPRILFLMSGSDDYVSDGLVHGLRHLIGERVVDWPRADQLYAGTPPEHRARRYGRGFTLYSGLLEDLPIDRTWITERVSEGEFDVVVVADITRRSGALVELMRVLPPSSTLVVVDGADTPKLSQQAPRSLLAPGGLLALRALRHAAFYFKREITPLTARSRAWWLLPEGLAQRVVGSRGLLPVGISIPAELVVESTDGPRDQRFQTHLVDPEVAALEGRTVEKPFTEQADYVADLRRSRFGITVKREGWDALRHYELAAAGAIPCFRHLHAKPADCAPHGLVDGVNCLAYDSAAELVARIEALTPEQERALREQAVAWARDHTTVAEATRFLRAIGH